MRKWLSAAALAGVVRGLRWVGNEPAGDRGAPRRKARRLHSLRSTKRSRNCLSTEVTIPAGTTLRLDLKSPCRPTRARSKTPCARHCDSPLSIDGQSGAAVRDRTRGDSDRRRAIRDGSRVARVWRIDSTHFVTTTSAIDITTAHDLSPGCSDQEEDAKKIGIGAGVGAAVGAIFGGGSGAAKGAAIGGAAGTGTVLATRGKEVRLGPGADVTHTLDGAAHRSCEDLARASRAARDCHVDCMRHLRASSAVARIAGCAEFPTATDVTGD